MSQLILAVKQTGNEKPVVWCIMQRVDGPNLRTEHREVKGVRLESDKDIAYGTDNTHTHPLGEFRDEFREEIIEYLEHKSADSILTWLIRHDIVPGIKSEVDAFVQKWAEKGVIIDL